MELSNSHIKKLLTFFQMKSFLIFQETKTPEIFFIFSQKKTFLIFPEMETPKKSFIFQETDISYISGNRNS